MAAEHGTVGPTGRYGLGPLSMVSAIAFQAWLSVAKPWGRTPWARASRDGASARPRRPPVGHPGMYALALVAPVVDWSLSTFVFGGPRPLLMLSIMIGYPIVRARRSRRTPERGSATTGDLAGTVTR